MYFSELEQMVKEVRENLDKTEETEQEQQEIPITYATIQRRIGWSRFAEETNRNVYAIKEHGDYPPNEVFYITEEQAKKLNL